VSVSGIYGCWIGGIPTGYRNPTDGWWGLGDVGGDFTNVLRKKA